MHSFIIKKNEFNVTSNPKEKTRIINLIIIKFLSSGAIKVTIIICSLCKRDQYILKLHLLSTFNANS